MRNLFRIGAGAVLMAFCTCGEEPRAPVPTFETIKAAVRAPSMSIARWEPLSVLLTNGSVLVAGGGGVTAETYDPLTNQFTPTAPAPFPIGGTGLTLHNGDAVSLGGQSGADFRRVLMYDPPDRAWREVMRRAGSRSYESLALLDDGRLLVAGGDNGFTDLNTAEIFAAETNTWSPATSMGAPRSRAAAARIGAQVLVVLGNAQLYDRPTNQWFNAGFSTAGTADATATLLPSGRVLVVGAGPRAQLFDPTTRQWSDTALGGAPRVDGTATLLPDGRLLLAGGSRVATGAALQDYVLYDEVQNAWLDGGTMSIPRFGHRAVMLPTGRVMILGGTNSTGDVAETELFDSFTPQSTAGPNLTLSLDGGATLSPLGGDRFLRIGGTGAPQSAEIFDGTAFQTTAAPKRSHAFHTATVLSSGHTMVVGGIDSQGAPTTHCEVFDPTSNNFALTPPLRASRSHHTAVLLADGRLLVIGGLGATGPLSDAEIFDPTSNTWTSYSGAPSGEVTATLLNNGEVLIAGGTQVARFIPGSGQIIPVATITQRRGHSSTLLNDGRVLISGGTDGQNALVSGLIFDPNTQILTPKASLRLNAARAFHAALVLNSGRVLVVGGENSTGAEALAEIFDPMTETWQPTLALPLAFRRPILQLMATGAVLMIGEKQQSLIFNEGPMLNDSHRPSFTLAGAITPGVLATINGTKLTGISEGSCGNARTSPSNHPVFVFSRIDNQAVTYASTWGYGDTTAAVMTPATLPIGRYHLRVVVNGISSASVPVELTTALAAPCTTCVDGGVAPDGGSIPDGGSTATNDVLKPRYFSIACGCSNTRVQDFGLFLLTAAYAIKRRRRVR